MRQIRIVIADDHPAVRAGLRDLLSDYPEFIVVGEAADGVEAVDMARQLHPDVVLMDVSMPRMDGIEATRHIRAELPSITIVGLSSHGRTEDANLIQTAGAAAYFTKDGDSHHLIDGLRAACPVI